MRESFALCDDPGMNLRRVRYAISLRRPVAIRPDCVGRISDLRVACAPRSVAIGVMTILGRQLAVRDDVVAVAIL